MIATASSTYHMINLSGLRRISEKHRVGAAARIACLLIGQFAKLKSIFAILVIHDVEPLVVGFIGFLTPALNLLPRELLAQLLVADRSWVEAVLPAVYFLVHMQILLRIVARQSVILSAIGSGQYVFMLFVIV